MIAAKIVPVHGRESRRCGCSSQYHKSCSQCYRRLEWYGLGRDSRGTGSDSARE